MLGLRLTRCDSLLHRSEPLALWIFGHRHHVRPLPTLVVVWQPCTAVPCSIVVPLSTFLPSVGPHSQHHLSTFPCHSHCGPGCGLDTALSARTQGLTLDLPALAESLSALSLHEVLSIEVEFLQGCELPNMLQGCLADLPSVRAEVAPQVRLCAVSCTALHVPPASLAPCCDDAFTSCSSFRRNLQADDGLPAGGWPQSSTHTRPWHHFRAKHTSGDSCQARTWA